MIAGTALAAGLAPAQQPPAERSPDSGRVVNVEQKSREELLTLLRALQLVPRTPEEQKRLLDQLENLPPEQKQQLKELAEKFKGGAGTTGLGGGLPNLPPGFDPSRFKQIPTQAPQPQIPQGKPPGE